MSKSNVNPNHYKVAGRERQGEDILQLRNKQKLAESLARERFEPHRPHPTYTGPSADEYLPQAPEAPSPDPGTAPERASPSSRTARKEPAPARAKRKAATRKAAKPVAKKRASAPRSGTAPNKPRGSAKAAKAASRKRAAARTAGQSRPAGRTAGGSTRKKSSTRPRGKR